MTSSELDYTRYLKLIKKRKVLFVVTALSIMTMAVAVSYILPKKYEASSTVFIEKNVMNDLVKGIAATPSMDDTIKVLTYAVNSRTLVLKVINALDLNVKAKSDAELEHLVKEFQDNTEVKVKDKDLFVISFKHESPRVARDYVNTLVRSYIEENVSSKREESFGATKFLSEQITTYKEKLEKVDAAVLDFKRQKGGVINLDEGRLLQEISSAQQKLYDLQLRRRLLEGQLRAVHKGTDPLLANLEALKKRLDELRVEYTENYPEVITVKADIESLQSQIDARKRMSFPSPEAQNVQKMETELAAIKESESSLQRYIAANQGLLERAPTAKATLEKLEAEKANQKNMYDQLFVRHDQSEVSKQMELQDKSAIFRIVDPAVMPVKKASPDRVRIILMGMAAGLAGGLGLLILLDILDQSVKDVSTLKTLNFPVLAVIPVMKSEESVQTERKRDLRFYVAGCLYFSLIVAVLALETLARFFPQLTAKLWSWF